MARIIAIGGGGFLEDHHPSMHHYVLAQSDASKPRVCFMATGKGDHPLLLDRFYSTFGNYACQPAHLALFERDVTDLAGFIRAQDIVLVWGGNTASMLAVWRRHGLTEILRDAARDGLVLAGLCAGSLVWFEDGVTDSFGALGALGGGLGWLKGSHCPHYDADPERRRVYHRLIGSGELGPGIAADVDAALRFEDGEIAEVVSSRPRAHAWRLWAEGNTVREERLDARLL